MIASSRRVVWLLLFVGFFLTSLLGIFSVFPFATWYHEGMSCDESRIVRTMLWKEHEGLWARGGFIADFWDPTAKGCYRTREDYQSLQAKEWEELKSDFKARTVYTSSPGWSTLLLYPFWRASQLLAVDHKDRLYIGVWILRAVSSLSTALALSLLCLWITRETSVFSGLFTGLGLMVLPIMPHLLYTMGRSPLYKPFFFFLPFLLVAFALQSRWRKRCPLQRRLPWVAGLAGIGVAGKVFFGLGYDMLPPVMVSATIPVFWYALRERWSLRQFSLWFGFCSLAALVGFAIAFVIHGLQVEAIGGDFLAHAKDRFLYRSRGFTETDSAFDCDGDNATNNATWIVSMACQSRLAVVFDTFRHQLPFLVLCAFCCGRRSVRVDLKARLHDARFASLWRATLVCVGIGAVAAISQPLVWKQATASHGWFGVSCWLLMFRPFALLALALLLEPSLLRWNVSVLERWRKNIDMR